MVFYGFINFVFGFGVFLVGFALWLRWRNDMSPARTLSVAALLVLSYLSHLAAFGLLGLAIVATIVFDELRGRSDRRGAIRSLGAFAPAIALLAYSTVARGSSGGGIVWGTPREKAQVAAGMYSTYDHRLDALWLGGALVLALAGVALSRRVELDPLAAVLTAVFALCFLLLPPSLITASNVDARVIPGVLALFLCAVRISPRPGVAASLCVCAVLLGGSRVAVIAVQWQHLSTKIASQVRRLDASLPRNADVYSLFPEDAPQIDKRERSFTHLASYAAIDRNAHVSRTFAERSQQPLVSRVDELTALDAVPPFTVNFATFRRYSYVWTYEPGATVRRQLHGRCTTVFDTRGFYLCRRRA
jgi:hypothetical protein